MKVLVVCVLEIAWGSEAREFGYYTQLPTQFMMNSESDFSSVYAEKAESFENYQFLLAVL
jgi:hypothetical protein